MNSFLNGLVASAVIGSAVAAAGPAVAQSINCPTTPAPMGPVLVCDAKHKLVGFADAPPPGYFPTYGTVVVRTQGTVLAMDWTTDGFVPMDPGHLYGSVPIDPKDAGLHWGYVKFYLSENCSGQAYLAPDPQPQLGYLYGGAVHFAGHPFQILPMNSVYGSGDVGVKKCYNIGTNGGVELRVGKETIVPLSKLGFTPPFSIE